MKFLVQTNITKPMLSVLITGLVISQVFVFPLQAEELVNISDVKDCRVIRGDVERLTCYDTIIDGGIFNEQKLREVQVEEFGADTMPKEKAPEPAVVPVPVPVAEAPATPAAATVSEASPAVVTADEPLPKAGKGVSANKLDVTIVRLKKGNNRIYYFQTSEGQVWKQQSAMSWNLKAPFEAKIEKGAMGSFFLIHEGGKSTRVKRVK